MPVDGNSHTNQPEVKVNLPDAVMEATTMGGPYIPVDDMNTEPIINPVQ